MRREFALAAGVGGVEIALDHHGQTAAHDAVALAPVKDTYKNVRSIKECATSRMAKNCESATHLRRDVCMRDVPSSAHHNADG